MCKKEGIGGQELLSKDALPLISIPRLIK
jgi:hypothetical protein